MDRIDDTEHFEQAAAADPPSLLITILDTNPYAWSKLQSTLPLKNALSHMLLFLNTHLAFSHANEVAVIASHTRSASFLYPSPSSPPSDIASQRDSNKYRKFRVVEDTVQVSLSELMQSTDAADISETNETMISGALSLALTYINRITASDDGTTSIARPGEEKGEVAKMNARILVISVSGDLANQYVSVMNSIFAAQRQRVPIDVCKIAGDTVFLQQASDSTNGTYMQLETPAALLQYLLTCFIPDNATRKHLVSPSQINVDFRAACFCHKRVVDIGFVCSICLSSRCPIANKFRELHLAHDKHVVAARRERLLLQEKKQKKQQQEGLLPRGDLNEDVAEVDSEESWENSIVDDLSSEALAMMRWWLGTLPDIIDPEKLGLYK